MLVDTQAALWGSFKDACQYHRLFQLVHSGGGLGGAHLYTQVQHRYEKWNEGQ